MFNKERLILDYLCARPDASQRGLALATGISLGQINSVLRNLCEDGLLRQEAVSKKKKKYTLTRRGLAERARLSNENILSAIRNYKKIKDIVANLLSGLYSKGYREFVLEGERGEIHDVISEVFDESMGDKASLVWGPADAKDGRVVLNLDRRFLETEHAVNVLHEIAI